MRGVYGILVTAIVVLAIIWAFNKFSGKNVASLGASAAA